MKWRMEGLFCLKQFLRKNAGKHRFKTQRFPPGPLKDLKKHFNPVLYNEWLDYHKLRKIMQ
jgi:hypothetical protein